MYGRLLLFEKRCVLCSYIILFVIRVRDSIFQIMGRSLTCLPILNSTNNNRQTDVII